MKLLAIFSVLAIAACANASYMRYADTLSDKDMFLTIIKCAKKAVIDGIPEIGLPTHDPLKISKNFTKELALGYNRFSFALENMFMEGIPYWEVTEMDEETVLKDNPVFDYTIYWKKMSFEGNWRIELVRDEDDDETEIFKDEGTFSFELDHLTFAGLFNFTKPKDNEEGGFNELTLHLHTKKSEVRIDGLGVTSTIIKLLGGSALTEIVNLDLLADVLGPGVRDKLNRDWIKKPERIEALISNCNLNLS